MHHNHDYRYCPLCAAALQTKQVKPGEPQRLVCSGCGFIFYLDPKVAACAVIRMADEIVLLRRSIPPGLGQWVIPGGFVDVGEPVPVAAARESLEEVCLTVAIGPLVGVYSYPQSPVIVIVYEAEVTGGHLRAGDEALAVERFSPQRIPWDQLAFLSTGDALKDYVRRHFPDLAGNPCQTQE